MQKTNHLNNIAIQGSGADSFTKYHFDKIKIPNFDKKIIDELSNIYNMSLKIKISENEFDFLKLIENLGLYQLELLKNCIVKNIKKSFKSIIEGKMFDKNDIINDIIKEYIEVQYGRSIK